MFNVIVNKEYELFFERLKAAAPDSFALSLADFSHPDEKLNVLLEKADAIIGQVNPSDSQYETAERLRIIQTMSAGSEKDRSGKRKYRKGI